LSMVTSVSQDPSKAGGCPFLSMVAPLNKQRRNDALYLLASEYERPLSQYDICKTVVLADAYHVIEFGKAIFGGKLYALPFGPVETETCNDCKEWVSRIAAIQFFARLKVVSAMPLRQFSSMGKQNHIALFRASPDYERREEASWDWFTDEEQGNIRRAYEKVVGMRWNQSQSYFHDPVSAIGYAYDVATKPYKKPFESSVEMNWFDVLDGAEKIDQYDASYARAMLRLWL
jgi:hypothetical protein